MPDRIRTLTGFPHLLIPLLLLFSRSGWSLPTKPVEVKASIVNGCLVSGSQPGVLGTLDFGTLPGINATTATATAAFMLSSTITLACTPGTQLKMSVNGGDNFANASRNLKLSNHTDLVAYALYTNASYTTAVPVDGELPVPLINANNITLPIYGRLQISGARRAGTYSDTLTVTLSW